VSRPVPLRPSAGADVLTLTSALARAGWGEGLAVPTFRGARVMLRELANAMFEARQGRRASIDITGPQLADRTGYSDRWVRESLATLEGLGLIEWYRGGIVEGAPKPSLIRIVKSTLADFVLAARRWHDDVLDARIVAVKTRIKATTIWRLCRGRKKRRDPHAEVASILPLFEGRKGAPAGVARPGPSSLKPNVPQETTKGNDMSNYPSEEFMPLVCGHGASAPRFCNRCRSEGWQQQQRAEQARQRAAEERAAEAARKDEEQAALPTPFEEYMRAAYPDATPRQWGRLALADPEAKRLVRESVR